MVRVPHISDDLISSLSDLINSRMGLHFPPERWRDLKRNMAAAASDLGFDDPEQCVRWILSAGLTQDEEDTLVGHLTIGETFFFRDKFIFQALRERILPALSTSRGGGKRRVRFWCAGCCTGEEPYSLAILIRETRTLSGHGVKIIATDINARFLEKAGKGVYTRWSFRDTPREILEKYFQKRGRNGFEISPDIRSMVDFHRHNLVRGGYPPGLDGNPEGGGKADLIFCRNVLIYLSPDMRDRVIKLLSACLAEEGSLIVSPSETPLITAPDLVPVRFPGAILHRKGRPGKGGAKPDGPLPATRTTSLPPARPMVSLDRKKADRGRSHPPLPGKKRRRAHGTDPYQEALTLFRKGRYREVTERLDTLLSRGDTGDKILLMPEQMALLAEAHANLGELDEARKWCERAVKAEKLHPDYHYLLATICHEQGLVDES